jgi:DNA/RNA-binding domain of Phe-tRNA-synthetase-like protein
MAHTDQCATCAMIQGILMSRGVSPSTAHEVAYSAPIRSAEKRVVKKAKRKVGKYQKVFGRKLKALKKKHPRTAASALMKRAHRETKKAMK